jgi:hypothetical protein
MLSGIRDKPICKRTPGWIKDLSPSTIVHFIVLCNERRIESTEPFGFGDGVD